MTTRRLKQALPWLAMVAFWVFVYGPKLYANARQSLEPEVMNDDVRIVHIHFFHWMDSALFANDTLGKYHADGTAELYRGLFYVVSKLGDPYAFTKLPPFFLYGVALVGLAVAAHRLGGKVGAFVAVTLCLGSQIMLGRMGGLLPRAFAYPLLAWFSVALVYGKIRMLAVLTVIGTGFYPVLSVLGGLSLAFVLLIQPAEDRGSAADWSLTKRVVWLVATAAACLLLTLPFTWRMAQYGRSITPALIAEFPEAGRGGRQDAATCPPFPALIKSWSDAAKQAVMGNGPRLVPFVGEPLVRERALREVLLDALAYLTLAGCALLGLRKDRGLRRLATLALAIGLGYVMADAVTPRLVVPPRYTLYGVPILTTLVVAAAPAGLFSMLEGRGRVWSWLRNFGAGAIAALIVACFGGGGNLTVGARRYGKAEDRALYGAIAMLPKSSLVAGWPEGVLETMPILSRRTPFLTRELHVPYHTEMTLRMRERMRALVAAYYATSLAPLVRLRDEFHVTHLVVEPSRLRKPSRYFEPFGREIARAAQLGRSKGFVVEEMRERATVFSDDKYYVLDLSRLPQL